MSFLSIKRDKKVTQSNKSSNIMNFVSFLYRRGNKSSDLPAPPGYNPSVGQSHNEVAMDTDQSHLILKKSWDIALGPIKQVSGFYSEMMYVSHVLVKSSINSIKELCFSLLDTKNICCS